MLLVSAVGLQTGRLPKGLNRLGLVIGAVGILSLITALNEMLTGIFGLGQMVWFVRLGVVLLRSHAGETALYGTPSSIATPL